MQTRNRYETLQEDKAISNADQQLDLVKEKLQANQQNDQNKENQGKETEIAPQKNKKLQKLIWSLLYNDNKRRSRKTQGQWNLSQKTWK